MRRARRWQGERGRRRIPARRPQAGGRRHRRRGLPARLHRAAPGRVAGRHRALPRDAGAQPGPAACATRSRARLLQCRRGRQRGLSLPPGAGGRGPAARRACPGAGVPRPDPAAQDVVGHRLALACARHQHQQRHQRPAGGAVRPAGAALRGRAGDQRHRAERQYRRRLRGADIARSALPDLRQPADAHLWREPVQRPDAEPACGAALPLRALRPAARADGAGAGARGRHVQPIGRVGSFRATGWWRRRGG